jgi:peptide deformylase
MVKSYFSKRIFIAIFFLSTFFSCTERGFNKQEMTRIMSSDANSVLPLFTIYDKSDSLFLRKEARKLKKATIVSSEMMQLKLRMLKTVLDSLNPGVGIAAPQVGIGVQMIYLQRLDKAGEPFEVYFNPKIEMYGDSINSGLEGCLSVPGFRGKVDRSHNISLSYTDSTGNKRTETINGFTAVIFQHEIDHLNGILYFDHVYGGYQSLIPTEPK